MKWTSLNETEQPGSNQYPLESQCLVVDQCCIGRPTCTPLQLVMVDVCAYLVPVKVDDTTEMQRDVHEY